MNERIKELAEQAMWHTNSKTGEVYRTHFQFEERFAELIIRDCLKIIFERQNEAIDGEWNVDEAMSIASMDIEEHFGVER